MVGQETTFYINKNLIWPAPNFNDCIAARECNQVPTPGLKFYQTVIMLLLSKEVNNNQSHNLDQQWANHGSPVTAHLCPRVAV